MSVKFKGVTSSADKELKVVIAKTWIVNVIMEFINTKMNGEEDHEVKEIIFRINDLEALVKKNTTNSMLFVSNFVSNY